jgi:hypothetical protein
VLRDRSSCSDLQQRLEVILRGFKDELNLFFLYESAIERAAGVMVHVWWEPQNPALDVRLVCDEVLGATYVNVTAPDASQQSRVLDALSSRLEFVPLAELQDRARQAHSDAAWILLALGVREDFDEATYDLIKDALESPTPPRRRAAGHAAAVLAWPQFAQLMRDALSREEDAETRAVLEIAVQAIEAGP